MPLFSKRSRSLSTTRPITPASNSAHLAAAQAFLASQPSQSNLSASAAAAALRTMSPPPQPVDQVQTKRMLNRQASNSSMGNSPRGRSRGVMQRRPSAGSMTERTFRSPSPAQQGLQPGSGSEAPPVPAVPQAYSEDLPPVPAAKHRRSASVDTPPRVASPRVTSPPSARPAGRGQSVDQSSRVSSAAAAAARKTANAPPVAPPSQLQRTDSQDSRNSYNFSYPRGSRPNSPPPRSPVVSAGENVSAPIANGISASEAARIQHHLTQAAAKPVKKKKQRVDPSAAQGSHLQTGTMGGKPTVTPLAPLPADYEPPPVQPVQKPKKKAALTGQSSHFPDNMESSMTTGTASDSDAASESPKEKRALRASGALMKQPSVVREDWEGEQGEQEEQDSSPIEAVEPVRIPSSTVTTPVQPKKTLPEANMSRKIEEPSSITKNLPVTSEALSQTKSSTVEAPKTLKPTLTESQSGRVASVSPSRSTRFSDRLASDLVLGRKHEPLGRSVSPAKSALKHLPASDASSPTDPRFPGRRGSSVTPSEASDVSVDGASTARKRSVARVSFEDPIDVKDTSTDIRSSKDSNKKTWTAFSKGKASNLGTITADGEEVEEGMKPRPALPSFGSVRRGDRSTSPSGKIDTPVEDSATYTKSASSSESSSIADPPTMDTSISSDHALGGLLLRESRKEPTYSHGQTDRDGLLSTVDRIDHAGYDSDTDSVYSEDDQKPFHAAQSASRELGKTVGSEQHLSPYHDEIPVIAVQPATPGLDEFRTGEDWGVETPEGISTSGGHSRILTEETGSDQASTPVKDSKNPEHARTTTGYSSWDSGTSPSQQLLPIAEEESDDNNSLYSDAAEDMSDLEGDGFGSINAIIESPIAPLQSKRIVSPPETPLAERRQQRPGEGIRTTSWEDTQAHWSGLAQRVRDDNHPSAEAIPTTASTSFNRAVTEDIPAEKDIPITTPKAQSATSPTVRATKPAPVQAPVTTAAPTKRVSPPAKTQGHLKTSMRDRAGPATAATQGHLRSSMRDRAEPAASTATTQGHLRSSMRDGTESAVAGARQRPNSYAGPPSPPRAALQKKHIPPAPVAAPKTLPRRFSNDSDSDSSFRKARRNRKPADGKYTMKRSMRSGPSEPERPSATNGRAGVRSMSPPTDRRPSSPMGTRTFRTSMRGSTDTAPTLRPTMEGKRSSSLFSRNRTAKSPTRPSTAVPAMPSKAKSRIMDSDDEDESRPTRFKSRFANSSDEDEPKTFRPVRGIPRKKDEADSTDLDDSSDDQGRRTKSKQKKLTVVPPPPSQEVVSPPVSPTTGKKRGLWSRLRGKKQEEEEVVEPVAVQTIAQREGIKDDIEAGKKQTGDAKQLGFSSEAEKEALIEQTRLKLEAAKERPQSPVGRPQSPLGRLQRRITPQRVLSDSFAAPKMPAATDDRPQTSDGVENVDRPVIGSRQSTADKVNGEGAVSAKTGKKKKFGLLRRAFGLTD